MIDPGARFAKDANTSAAGVGSETLLVQLVTGTTFRLNATGTVVWNALETGRSAADIVGAIRSSLDVDATRLQSDVLALLDQLFEARLVQRLDRR